MGGHLKLRLHCLQLEISIVFLNEKTFWTNEIRFGKGCCLENKRTMDKQNGSFREIEKLSFLLKTNEKNKKNDLK